MPGGATLAERLRQISEAGGMYAVPTGFDAAEGDWQTIHATDPFERLYLDWRLGARITAEMVKRHYDLLESFWTGKVRAMQGGANKERYKERFGGAYKSEGLVLSYPQKLRDAYQELATAEQIRAAYEYRIGQRLRDAERDLEPLVRQSLLDGILSPDEGKALLEAGETSGMSRDEAAAFVLRSLADRGFQPGRRVEGMLVPDQVSLVRWSSPEANRSPRATNPFKFEETSVHTLPELADACAQFAREASGYLAAGYLERWIAGDLGLAPLAGRVKRVAAEYADSPRRAVAVLERSILDQVGVDASPCLLVEPAILELGVVAQGQSTIGYLALREENGRHAWGQVSANRELPGFQYPPAFEGNGRCELILDTTWITPGEQDVELAFAAEGAVNPVTVRVRFEVLPLTVRVVPEAIAFSLRYGQSAERSLSVQVSPDRGRVLAAPALTDAIPGLTAQGMIDGPGGQVTLLMDARCLRAGTRRSTELVLRSNAGEHRIPVLVEVGFNRTGAVLWTLCGAVVGGLGMLGLRSILVGAAGGPRWITSPARADGLYLASTLTMSILVGSVYLLWRLFRKLAPRESPVSAGAALGEAVGAAQTRPEARNSIAKLVVIVGAVFCAGWSIVRLTGARADPGAVAGGGAHAAPITMDTTAAAPVAAAAPASPASIVAAAAETPTEPAPTSRSATAAQPPRSETDPPDRRVRPAAEAKPQGRAAEPAASSYAFVFDDLNAAEQAMNQGQYAVTRRRLRESYQQLDNINAQYPQSHKVAELKTRVLNLIARAGNACDAEIELAVRRGNAPPVCD
jgi:hypothetical protein